MRQPFDVLEAFHQVVYGYRPGVPELAAKLGISPGVLYNKANTNDPVHHKPTLGESVAVQIITGDTRIVQAMAAVLGGVFVPLHQDVDVCDDELLDIVAKWMSEQGRFFAEMKLALADGEVDKKEHAALRESAQFVVAAVFELWERLGQMQRRAPCAA
jgi:hypothetical protein